MKHEYAKIDGFWNSDKQPFENYLVCLRPYLEGEEDDHIFYFFEGEEELEFVKNNTTNDNEFTITNYTLI